MPRSDSIRTLLAHPCPDGRSLHRVRDSLLAFVFPNLPIGFWKQQPSHASGTRVPESLDAFTSLCSASPLPPVEGGGAPSFQRRPPHPPVEGGGAAPFQRRPLRSPPGQLRSSACGGSESGVDAARAGSQVPVLVLVPLAPVAPDGPWASRAGRVNQASCGAVRHDWAALCHPQQRIDQRSAWRRRQSCQGPPGRAPSHPIH